jgi:hypothetical protein
MGISKCSGVNCPFQQYCYRFTAKSNEENQYYLLAVPYDPEAHDCEFYHSDIEKTPDTTMLRRKPEKETRKRKKYGTK